MKKLKNFIKIQANNLKENNYLLYMMKKHKNNNNKLKLVLNMKIKKMVKILLSYKKNFHKVHNL